MHSRGSREQASTSPQGSWPRRENRGENSD
jgi:hypothetical protein